MIFPLTRLNEFFEEKLPFNGIISVYGDFGVGKTTFSLQTLINTVLSDEDVIFIYTKRNIPLNKLKMLINEKNTFDIKDITDKISILKISNFEDLRKLSFNIEFFILEKQNKKKKIPKLIIIDSITDLYRISLNKDKKEINIRLNYQLNQILANLQYLNRKFGIEIIIINDITRFNQEDQNFEIQSGGKVMNYWTSISIKISRTQVPNQRSFELINSQENNKIEMIASLTKNGF